MKFYVNLVIVIGVLAAIMYFLSTRESEQEKPAPASATPEQPATVAAPTPTPIPQPTPVPPQPSGGVDPRLQQAAQRAQVTIAGVSPQPGGVVVVVRAYDRNHLGDLLDACITVGLRDVDTDRSNYRQLQDSRGRVIYQDTYKLKF